MATGQTTRVALCRKLRHEIPNERSLTMTAVPPVKPTAPVKVTAPKPAAPVKVATAPVKPTRKPTASKPTASVKPAAPVKVAPVKVAPTTIATVDFDALRVKVARGQTVRVGAPTDANERSRMVKRIYHLGYNNGFRGNFTVKLDKGVIVAGPKVASAARTELRVARGTVKPTARKARKATDALAAAPASSETGSASANARKLLGKTA